MEEQTETGAMKKTWESSYRWNNVRSAQKLHGGDFMRKGKEMISLTLLLVITGIEKIRNLVESTSSKAAYKPSVSPSRKNIPSTDIFGFEMTTSNWNFMRRNASILSFSLIKSWLLAVTQTNINGRICLLITFRIVICDDRMNNEKYIILASPPTPIANQWLKRVGSLAGPIPDLNHLEYSKP